MNLQTNPILVTGLGVCAGDGEDSHRLARRLEAGETMIQQLESGTRGQLSLGAFFPVPTVDRIAQMGEAVRDGLGSVIKKTLRQAPDGILLSVCAAFEAWSQARLPLRHSPERIGVIVGGTGLSLDWIRQVEALFQRSPEYLPSHYAMTFMDSHLIGLLSYFLGIKGVGFQVSCASASGNLVIREGMRLIRDGEVDACLVVGAPSDWSPKEWKAFEKIGALNNGGPGIGPGSCCPFDIRHAGFTPGRMAAAFTLERIGKPSTAPISKVWGEFLSCGFCLDGTYLPEPTAEGEARAMRLALGQAGMDASEIEYINAHGTASPLGDRTEMEAISSVFGANQPAPLINATKAITGHCLNSSGAVEAASVLLQMDGEFLHGNIHLETPIPGSMPLVGPRSIRKPIRLAISNSFGFGGVNTALVIRSHNPQQDGES